MKNINYYEYYVINNMVLQDVADSCVDMSHLQMLMSEIEDNLCFGTFEARSQFKEAFKLGYIAAHMVKVNETA